MDLASKERIISSRNNTMKPYVFSERQEQVFLGSMLGDGSICKSGPGNKHYEYRELHGMEQIEYLQWKKDIFADFGATFKVNKKNCLLRIPPNPLFDAYRTLFYGSGNKKLIVP